MKYVLGFGFNPDMSRVFLMRRLKDPYKGLLNGVGGKIEKGELPREAMLREILEETNLGGRAITKVIPLVECYYPSGVSLNVFYYIIEKGAQPFCKGPEGIYDWYQIRELVLYAHNPDFAGEGDVAYFINYALHLEKKDPCPFRMGQIIKLN